MKVGSAVAWLDVPARTAAKHSAQAGTMLKRGTRSKAWRSRFFVLRHEWLVYYEDEVSGSPVGAIYLEGAEVVAVGAEGGQPECVRVTIPSHKDYLLSVERGDTRRWVECLTNASYTNLKRRLHAIEENGEQMTLKLQHQEQLTNQILRLTEELNKTQEQEEQLRSELEAIRSAELQAQQRQLTASMARKVSSSPAPPGQGDIARACHHRSTHVTLIEGYLFKHKMLNLVRRRRWCMVSGFTLMTFRHREDATPQSVIPLEHCVLQAANVQDAAFSFSLLHCVTDRTFVFSATCSDERDRWVQAITTAMEEAEEQKLGTALPLASNEDPTAVFEAKARALQTDVGDFDTVLKNEQQLECFRAFLGKEHSQENLLFYLDVENFKQSAEENLVIAAQNIYLRYIGYDAPLEINVSSAVLEGVAEKVDNPTPEIFDGVQFEVFRLMRDDSFRRFRTQVNALRSAQPS